MCWMKDNQAFACSSLVLFKQSVMYTHKKVNNNKKGLLFVILCRVVKMIYYKLLQSSVYTFALDYRHTRNCKTYTITLIQVPTLSSCACLSVTIDLLKANNNTNRKYKYCRAGSQSYHYHIMKSAETQIDCTVLQVYGLNVIR